MTSDEHPRPYRAKDAPGQEAADALAAVLQHAREREEAQHKPEPPKKQPKWMLPLGVNLGVFAVYLLIAPPSWVVLNPLEPPPVEERVEGARIALFLQAQRIQTYLQQNGRLPEALEEAGSPVPGAEYIPLGPRDFVLRLRIGDQIVEYRSDRPAEEQVTTDLAVRVRASG